MIRRFATAFTIVAFSSAFGAATVLAQPAAPKPAAKADSTGAHFVGSWEGTLYSEHTGDSPLVLTVAIKPATKMTMVLTVHGETVPLGEPSNVKFDGNGITWTQPMMEQECKASGVLIDGALKGELACGPMTATYLARKK